MNFNIDAIIFICFLIATIGLGLFSSFGVRNIKEYAVGDRNFSTATIVATIVASWITGETFYTTINETYNNGLYAICVALGSDVICVLVVGTFFAKRMGEFLGKLSIAEAMGDLFGQKARVITALFGFTMLAGLIGVQLKLTGLIFEHSIGINPQYGIIIATIIVTLYSSLGGIKSVTFTDIIQFITFGVTIPIVAYVLLTSINNIDTVAQTLATNPSFDYRVVFDFSNDITIKYFLLFVFFAAPGFDPVTFQRIAMAKNTIQIKQSFTIAAIICLFLGCMLEWIAVLILSINPSLNSSEIFKLIILDSSFIGLKGLVLSGIMAMIMSTVDSCINASSVLIVNDLLKPLKFSPFKNELISARFASFLVGMLSLFISLRDGGLQELLVISVSFYMPIVSMPFIMATLGFRSSEKSVLLGMFAGFTSVILWDYVFQIELGNSIPAGMLANLIVLMASHYLLGQPGGWVGIKDYSEVIEGRKARRRNIKKLFSAIKNFNPLEYVKNNYPKGDGLISILGFFVMISVFSSAHTLPKEIQTQFSYLLTKLYPICLVSSALLISYPLWLPYWREKKWIGIVWNFVTFFVLTCFSFLMVLVSNFSEMQIIAFMMNIVLISALSRWQSTLFNIIFGIGLVYICNVYYLEVDYIESSSISFQFKIIYMLLLISSVLVLFLKPRQEHQEITDKKVGHLSERIEIKEKEAQEALSLKAEFIRNVNHEYNTPITGVMSMAEALQTAYDKLDDEERQQAIDVIVKSSMRLKEYDQNINTLARLNKPNQNILKVSFDLSSLIYERVEFCQKLYETDKLDRELSLDIDEGTIVNGDKSYIVQLLDNLIINAIKYCTKGKINIKLKRHEKNIELVIQDEGIGIPQEELFEIFEPFVVSSKTKSQSGGRGVGLSACKKIVEVHGGTIKAESDGKKGAIFTVVLPG